MGRRGLRRGVIVIEPRIWIGYGLIVLMIVAVIAAAVYLRYNSPEQKYRRAERRERARYDERFPS